MERTTMKLPALLMMAVLAGCTAQVTHPTKSVAEMQVDIDQCTDHASRKYWMDPVAALYNAYDCLEAMGYQRSHKDLAARVEQAIEGTGPRTEAEAQPKAPPGPCRVPCTRPRS
ncbi:hypothetical protein E2493_00850 [Sphingomonas parva]|uniref:Uncharacterized protein n=1 Tax=Sphingomonas parva TaxID=2555898 RepID=A0A4Y8ZW72_9SPHN|nr:hypothetical protein [Sphingomonas parva]TFI60291.1 hypothetical protein E2493_00850 [Sphingomonas parva]